jgi:hypothetical protein
MVFLIAQRSDNDQNKGLTALGLLNNAKVEVLHLIAAVVAKIRASDAQGAKGPFGKSTRVTEREIVPHFLVSLKTTSKITHIKSFITFYMSAHV